MNAQIGVRGREGRLEPLGIDVRRVGSFADGKLREIVAVDRTLEAIERVADGETNVHTDRVAATPIDSGIAFGVVPDRLRRAIDRDRRRVPGFSLDVVRPRDDGTPLGNPHR